MYYNGKKEFYFKQYGIPILTLAFSILLVGSGIYIYWAASTSHTSNNQMIIASNELQNVDNQISNVSILGEKLESLTSLQKSEEGTVTEVKDDASIIFLLEDKQIQINLLGVDTATPSESLIAKMKDDLLNKKAKLSFEDERIVGNNIYAYVYIDNSTLYNEKIIESGLAKINTESKNLSYQNDLIQAQAYAKQLARGVWKR